MRIAISGLCALAFVASPVLAQNAGPANPPVAGVIQSFDGKTLSGWCYKPEEPFTDKTESSDKRYSVKDGILVVNPGMGIRQLNTVEKFGTDFVLTLEFR